MRLGGIVRRHRNKISALILSGILALGACSTPPPPCNCGDIVDKLASSYQDYHQCLNDRGLLRQRLKALEEKNP